MLEDERKAAAAALREELRNGRNGIRESGEDVGGIGQSGADQVRATIQPGEGTDGITAPDDSRSPYRFIPTGGTLPASDRKSGSDRRSAPAGPRSTGRSDRRHRQRDGGPADAATAGERRERREPVSAVGRLETYETVLRPDEPEADFETRQDNREIPITNVDFTRKRDYKASKRDGKRVYVHEPTGKIISPEQYKSLAREEKLGENAARREHSILQKGKVLSEREARELEEPLKAAIADEFHIFDQLLWLRCPQIDQDDIWGNVTEDEIDKNVELMLKGGQHNPVMAGIVRGMVDLHVYAVVGAMYAPRVKKTADALRETPLRNQPIIHITPFRRRKKA